MKFLIQNNLMNKDQLQGIKVAVEPFPHEYVGVIPFSRIIEPEIDSVDYIPYGSTLFTNIAYARGLKGLHFDLSKFNYEAAVANRNDMLNGDMIVSITLAINFLDSIHQESTVFIRPSEDLKQFSGQVIKAGECKAWLLDAMMCESSGSYKLEQDTKVVISLPKHIQAEWRWFIVGGKIVSGSMYRAHGQLRKIRETDADVIAEAQKLADQWLPDSCVVMDTALVNNKVKVIEFNCINSSGFYDNDIDAVFRALYQYHVKF